MRKDLHNIS